MQTRLTGCEEYLRESFQAGWLDKMTVDRYIMPLQAYLSGIELLEQNQDHLEYILREYTENLSPMAIRDICYAFVSIDQYRDYMVEELSSASVDQTNNIRLSQENALMIQMYQQSMNQSLDILSTEHRIVLEEQ